MAQSQSTNTENTYAYLQVKSQLESHVIGMKELRHIMLIIVVTTIHHHFKLIEDFRAYIVCHCAPKALFDVYSDFHSNFLSNDSICSSHPNDLPYSSNILSSFPLLVFTIALLTEKFFFLQVICLILSFMTKLNYHLHSGTFHDHTNLK